MKRITVISDYNRVRGLVRLPDGSPDILDLRAEFEAILDPGENPRAYDTPTQTEWLDKVRHREAVLVEKYGGSKSGGNGIVPEETIYSPKTFIGWLVKEKGAKLLAFSEYCMAEFD